MSDLVLENRLTISYLGDNRVLVTAGERCFEADQRTHVRRPDGRFCPLELVAAALGTWMVLTMAAVADAKGITCTRLGASVESVSEFEGRATSTRFVSSLDLGEGLSPREQRILYNSARLCEVHKMLRGEIAFEEHLLGIER